MLHALLDKTTPDHITDGYASGTAFHAAEFFFGIIVGLLIAGFLWLIISTVKSNVIDCKKDSDEKEKSE